MLAGMSTTNGGSNPRDSSGHAPGGGAELDVIDVLRREFEITEQEIARRTRVPRATVASIVKALERGQLATTSTTSSAHGRGSQGGRPPNTVALEPEAGIAMGIDFGHRHLRVALGGLTGVNLLEETVDEELDIDAQARDSLEAAVRLAVQALGAFPVEKLVGVCVGVPGPVDETRGTIASPNVMDDWRGFRPAEQLQRRLQWDTHFFVENDANLGLLAEREHGAASGATNVIYVKWASGLGAGLAIDGHLYRGTRGIAAELGHMPIPGADKRGANCPRCHQRGCLEMVAGGDAIVRAMDQESGLRFKDVLDAARASPGDARTAIQDAAVQVGKTLGPMVTVLNPELVVVGGLFGPADYSWVADHVLEGIREHCFPPALDDLTVRMGEHRLEAEARGGVITVLRKYASRYLVDRLPA